MGKEQNQGVTRGYSMNIVITILAFLGMLAVIILAHELGHFTTAKLTGITVEEFGIGFPPRLLSITWGETRYSLNAIPLGGFTKLLGEEDPTHPKSFASKNIPTRLLVLGAGALMNLLLPVLLFSIALMVPHDVVVGEVMVEEVSLNSPAELAGIQPGDRILNVGGEVIRNITDVLRQFEANLGQEVSILLEHPDSTTSEVQIIPRWRVTEGEGATGLLISLSNPNVISQSEPFWRAIPYGVQQCIDTLVLFKNAIIGMIIGARPVVIAGPVGIAQLTGQVARAGISPLLELAAFFSINLAIVNLIPLPALDGGRISFVLLEWMRRGKRISPKTENLIHLIGFGILLGLLVLLTYQDIARIISGGSLIP